MGLRDEIYSWLVAREHRTTGVSQEQYLRKTLKKRGVAECSPVRGDTRDDCSV